MYYMLMTGGGYILAAMRAVYRGPLDSFDAYLWSHRNILTYKIKTVKEFLQIWSRLKGYVLFWTVA
jgi:hypothetical protein